jgi:preprotein translocase subunit SecE
MWQYFKDVRAEMRHVSWPSRAQTIAYTVVVIGVSLGVALYLGFWDYLFAALLRHII